MASLDPSHDPEVRHEPVNHNPSMSDKDQPLDGGGRVRQAAEQSVFDEPFPVKRSDQSATIDRNASCPECGYNLRGGGAGNPCPECGHRFDGGYAQWLESRFQQASATTGYVVVLAVMLVGGVLAVGGTLLGSLMSQLGFGLFGMVVFGPTIEEVMKVLAVVVVLERWPWLLPNRVSVVLAALAGALGFAVIENLMYLNIYIDQPTETIIAWRWTVCTALHVVATSITAIGLSRLWCRAATRFEPVELPMALPYLVVAIVVHGSYNALALLLEWRGLFEYASCPTFVERLAL